MLIDIVMLVICGIFVAAIIALFAIVIWQSNKHKKRLEDISLYQINVNAIIDNTIPEILDLLITDSFRDYRIMYLEPLNEGYIASEREQEIRKDVVFLVTNRLSSAAMDKLSLFYNIENIADILADKIYIMVMSYCIEHNAHLENVVK